MFFLENTEALISLFHYIISFSQENTIIKNQIKLDDMKINKAYDLVISEIDNISEGGYVTYESFQNYYYQNIVNLNRNNSIKILEFYNNIYTQFGEGQKIMTKKLKVILWFLRKDKKDYDNRMVSEYFKYQKNLKINSLYEFYYFIIKINNYYNQKKIIKNSQVLANILANNILKRVHIQKNINSFDMMVDMNVDMMVNNKVDMMVDKTVDLTVDMTVDMNVDMAVDMIVDSVNNLI